MPDEPRIADPVVAVGMEKVTILVGGAHPHDVHLADSRDRATVIEALQKLQSAGYEFDASELAAWAVANHWRPEAVEQLKDYAERIKQGKPPRKPTGTGERLKHDIVERWQEEAEGRS